MCRMRRRTSVPKNTLPNDTQTTAMIRSMNHSGSAYSLACVMPKGIVNMARKHATRQPHVAGALHDVVARAQQRRAAEREDHAERVVGADAAECQPRDVEVECRP